MRKMYNKTNILGADYLEIILSW